MDASKRTVPIVRAGEAQGRNMASKNKSPFVPLVVVGYHVFAYGNLFKEVVLIYEWSCQQWKVPGIFTPALDNAALEVS